MASSPLPIQPSIGRVRIASPEEGHSVTLDSAALLVMTDLKRVTAATVSPNATMEQAHAFMMQRGVRMLLAVDQEDGSLAGIVTATDVLGEKPMGLVRDRGVRHSEILVSDIMTPAERLEAFDMHTVRSARVGQVVASLQEARRHHALVVQRAHDGLTEVRGLFSLTQIARQLGTPLQLPDRAGSFAELEAALA